ncbi:hypothetical protein CVD28_04755 [Bacillus sp. M6-12]|uniref:copper amine oxidase N-terminal domain-containing protein n=1 Tax=Bacillus sp. M6-12 TaxID=2054166 RepID=UPI000C773F66|nr:copper amine oxidase N-terminal domain-containing protein [Bacillus sp. M6-12]PLS19726.1 hypothetical protein CVD28_04755 [Bacillus sp. M6-12]
MRVKSNLQNLFNFKVVAVIMAMIMVISYLSFSGTADVVKVNGDNTGNAPFVQNGHTYVPLNEISQKMGDEVTSISNQQKVVIQQKNGTVVSVKANQARAIFNGKIVPLKTKQLNQVIVPVNAKAIFKNGQVYVPVEFLSDSKGMTYPVKVVNEGGNTVIYVGTIPAPTKEEPKPSEPTQPAPSQPKQPEPKPSKPSQPAPAPAPAPAPTQPAPKQPTQPSQPSTGEWVAPVLKSAWSPNHATNLATLKNELGFRDDGSKYSLPEYPGAMYVIERSPDSPYEVDLTWKFWTSKSLATSYRIPIVSKELFKLYFGSDANRVWNYFNSNDIPDTFTANGRTVEAGFDATTGTVYLKVGRK